MRLLVAVMEVVREELLPVRERPEDAATIAGLLLGPDVTGVESAADEHGPDDYWMTVPADVVAAHTVAPGILQAYREDVGLVAASIASTTTEGV